MGNIINNNVHNLKLKINYDEYWDFFLNKDSMSFYNFNPNDLYTKCLVSYVDISNQECLDGEWIYGLKDYSWEYKNVTNNTLYNIGYTGVDNGLIRFRKDRISNKDFLEIYTNSKYEIKETDTFLKLHQVSGNTLLYEYPSKIENNSLKLNGGFYQGFFETQCDKYKVLPNVLDDEWNFEFVLKKEELISESNKTLNDKYPNNKGIFFYIGTRAENKWIYLYDDNECGDVSPDNFVEDARIEKKDYIIGNFYDPSPEFKDFYIDNYISDKYYSQKIYDDVIENDETLIEYLDLNEKPPIIDEKNNTFINIDFCKKQECNINEIKIVKNNILSCGCSVKKSCQTIIVNDGFGDEYLSDEDDTDFIEPELNISDFEYETKDGFNLKFANQYAIETDNKFLLFDRTCDGFTTENWKEGTKVMYQGIKHKFKGNLFLLMNRTCTGYTVENIDEYRKKDDLKYNVNKDIYNNALGFQITDKGEIGYRYLTLDCDSENKLKLEKGFSKENIIKENEWSVVNVKIKNLITSMRIYFYVNGKLVFITKELQKLNLRELDEIYEKQEGVPYNISLGGGTQGLAETIQPNYMLLPSQVFPIEKYFAGTFIGYIKSFKFYNCRLEYTNILNNFKFEMDRIV